MRTSGTLCKGKQRAQRQFEASSFLEKLTVHLLPIIALSFAAGIALPIPWPGALGLLLATATRRLRPLRIPVLALAARLTPAPVMNCAHVMPVFRARSIDTVFSIFMDNKDKVWQS